MPTTRQRRSWYMPVSLAAVLVLSVSLVVLVHQEKGDELAQPPPPASVPPAPAKPDTTLHDVAPPTPKVTQERPAEPAQGPVAPEAVGELAKKQRAQMETIEAKANGATAPVGALRMDERAEAAKVLKAEPTLQTGREAPRSDSPSRPSAPVAGVAAGGLSTATQTPAPAAAAVERRPEPLPAVSEREAAAQANRDTAQGRARSEADRAIARSTMTETPVVPVPAPAPPRSVSAAEDIQAPVAPALSERRMRAVPPPPSTGAAPVQRRGGGPLPATRPAWLVQLDNQSPEKWLERLAEFRRDGRQADADALMVEFRRLFPDHPASAR